MPCTRRRVDAGTSAERARDELNDGGDMLISNPNHRGADWPSSGSEDASDDGEEADSAEDEEDDADYEVDKLGNRIAKAKLV